MKKSLAVMCTIALHLLFIAGLATTATTSVEIAADRASHVMFIG